MRYYLLALITVLLFVGCKQKTKVQVIKGPAQMEFINDERTYEFGTVSRKNARFTHDFKFVNKGSEPLVIHEVKTSCHCVSVDYPRSPIMSGDEGIIHVKLDFESQPEGYVKRSAYIYNNSSNRPEVRLVFEGIIED